MIKSTLQAITKLVYLFSLILATACSNNGTETTDPPSPPEPSPIPIAISFDLVSTNYSSNLTNFQICLEGVEFRVDPSSNETSSYFLPTPSLISIDPSGTNLGPIELLSGTYFDLKLLISNSCNSSLSLRVQNSSGIFTTTSQLTINFSGTATLEEATDELIINFSNITNFLSTVTSETQIDSDLVNTEGTF